MAKAQYAVVGGTTRKIKKKYSVVDGKTRAIKKEYVVIDGKTKLIWSGGANPLFLITSRISSGNMLTVHLSEDLVDWEKIEISQASSTCAFKSAYGNGLYAIVQVNRATTNQATMDLNVFTSSDGRIWTKQTIGTYGMLVTGFPNFNIQFCNGQFIITCSHYESGNKYQVYTSSDGKTWTKKVISYVALPATDARKIVYGYYNNQFCYVAPNGSSILYSTDLSTWTSSSVSLGYDISSLQVSKDGTIFAAYGSTSSPQLSKINSNGTITTVGTASVSSGYINGSCYNGDNDEIAMLVGSNSSNDSSIKRLYITNNKSSLQQTQGYHYSTYSLRGGGFVYGSGKYCSISAKGSTTDVVKCHYSLDSGTTWTEVVIGTVRTTGIDYLNSDMVYGSGE